MKKRILLSLLALVLFTGSCTIDPPLHLRKTAETSIILVPTITTSFMWQVDWQTQWQFNWSTDQFGPLEYVVPTAVRMHDYTLNELLVPKQHDVYNFNGTTGQVQLFQGIHNLLFHNIGSEVNLFRSDDDLSDVHAYTRVISSGLKASMPVMTLEQKEALTRSEAEMEIDEPVVLMPDQLFTMYDVHREISDNLEDFEYIDGKYVLHIRGTLEPVTYIYLIQIKLINNLGRVTGSMGGAALTGMADDVCLPTKMNSTSTVSVPMDVHINKAADPDLLGARVLTFGIPGCNPSDPASLANAPAGKHYLVANICFATGQYKNINIDVTDQIRALPTGGVITLELDVNDFPPEIIDPPIGDGGGFNALIGDWNEKIGTTTVIN
ncbi:MAG: DUF5119 domain-containing protein [Bacteroidales bacterium]|nr:DUF5119 domain-containing protein [Bacteroidales bacterium]